jgi:hypothetical protein
MQHLPPNGLELIRRPRRNRGYDWFRWRKPRIVG